MSAEEVLCDEEPAPDPAACQHKWQFVRDWIGDPSIPNGVLDWSVWHCGLCDRTTDERPDDWEDPGELQADYERDRRIDDKLTGWTT